jgi:hypothetical protein
MMDPAQKPEDTQTVWRYMSFGRFMWLLQKKQLWLSRADQLGDDWEIALAGEQLKRVIARHPISPLSDPPERTESAMERARRILALWRRQTFVSCWSESDHESHALWSIYCNTTEGVAIQTSLAKLRLSVGQLPVYRVAYGVPGENPRTPNLAELVTKKRLMFDYEREVRVVRLPEQGKPDPPQDVMAHAIEWNPEGLIDSIRIHPKADGGFMETVTAAVGYYAPTLKEKILWSGMRDAPPC